jgi:hypothetical protein
MQLTITRGTPTFYDVKQHAQRPDNSSPAPRSRHQLQYIYDTPEPRLIKNSQKLFGKF